MKRLLFTALLLTSTAALAMEGTAPAMPPMAQGGGSGGQNHHMDMEKNFEQHKAKMLKFGEHRIAAIQKRQACIQAATVPKALKDCFSNMEGPPDMEGHPGMEGPPGMGIPPGMEGPPEGHHGYGKPRIHPPMDHMPPMGAPPGGK